MKERKGCSPIGRLKQLFSGGQTDENLPRVIEEFDVRHEHEFTGDEGTETSFPGPTQPGKNGDSKGNESWY